jgi:hypothetical protein
MTPDFSSDATSPCSSVRTAADFSSDATDPVGDTMSTGPSTPSIKKFRVWHIPQIPMNAFYVEVPDIETAKVVATLLADYDRFQFENKIKPDYANASGLETLIDGEWEEWSSEEDGREIWDIIRGEM